MPEDDVMRELWQVKDRLAAEFGHDVRKMVADLRRDQAKHDRQVVQRPRRAVRA